MAIAAEQMVNELRAMALECVEHGRPMTPQDVLGVVGDDLDALAAELAPSLVEIGFTHVAECVECGSRIFKHPAWSHFGVEGSEFDHTAEARLGTIRDWPAG